MKYRSEREMQASTLLRDGDYSSTRDMIERIGRMIPNNKIFAELDKERQIRYTTAKELRDEVMNLGEGLVAAGLKDAHIAIVADNSVRYIMCDIAISSGVGVVVPVDKDACVESLVTYFTKADITAVICGANCLEKVRKAQERCPLLKQIFTIDTKVDGFVSYDELVAGGKEVGESGEYHTMTLDVDKPAKILFTSGTTGANKGVVLTNANLAANFINCMDTIRAVEGNTSMSILPMHHATEINTHIMTRVASGRLTYINDSIRNMMNNIKVFKPDMITVVPMVANMFYKNIWAAAEKNGKAEKLRKGIRISNFLRKFGIDKTRKMFAEIYAPFGGNLYAIVCGGSMLNPVVVKGMNDLGIHIENGYGITECGPLVSINGNTLEDCLSVGKTCPGLEAKLANVDEDGIGELCFRGKSVAMGYYKDEEATKAAFDQDGFFNTGDSAYFGKNGDIYLIGRKKNTIVLPCGKNLCPEEVENAIEANVPYADDIVVYQASYKNVSQNVLCAGLYINDEKIRADRARVEADIKKVNATLPSYKRIDYVELPAEAYEKTSSHKIRRATLPSTCSADGIRIF